LFPESVVKLSVLVFFKLSQFNKLVPIEFWGKESIPIFSGEKLVAINVNSTDDSNKFLFWNMSVTFVEEFSQEGIINFCVGLFIFTVDDSMPSAIMRVISTVLEVALDVFSVFLKSKFLVKNVCKS